MGKHSQQERLPQRYVSHYIIKNIKNKIKKPQKCLIMGFSSILDFVIVIKVLLFHHHSLELKINLVFGFEVILMLSETNC